jgi:hypothetical protein
MAGSHYYTKDGELIDGDLRQCRKLGGLPSPTTVLNILGSPGLKYYFRRQMWEAACTTPRHIGMSDEAHWEACQKFADEHGQAARDKGGDFHSLVQQFHYHPDRAPAFGYDAQAMGMRPQFEAYVDWYSKNVRRSLMVEQAVIGQGYAGRVDHVAEMMDGKVLCLDVKTQDTTKKKGKFTYYDQWPIQLGAYAGACKIPIDGLMSVAVSSNLPAVVETKLWEHTIDYYHDIFIGLLKFWKHSNDYYPQ